MPERVVIALLFGALVLPATADEHPNVLMIAMDDLNDWVGVLGGHPQVKTPNLDRLAGRGVLFADAHTAAPICNPSRAALMTGLLPSTTGVYDNNHVFRTALPDAVTLPQHFRNHGYRTEGGGKLFHHGRGFNDPRSWDDYFFWNSTARSNGWFDGYTRPPDPEPKRPAVQILEVTRRNFDWAPMHVPEQDFPDHKVATWAAASLRREHQQPFFLAVGIFRPHIPWFVPRKYYDMYPLEEVIVSPVKEDDLADLPLAARDMAVYDRVDARHDLVLSTGNFRKAVQAYLACITFADAMVGRILEALDASPHRDNTIVVLWSDHGYHLGEKWRWHKHALWNRATHVPLIISAPGVTKPGTRCEAPVSLIDLYPTLADLAGLPTPEGLDGQSLRPLLEDPRRASGRPALITYLRGNHALRTPTYSYIRYADGSEELYHRRQDPDEWVNLANAREMRVVVEELRTSLPAKDAPNAAPASEFTFDPATVSWTRKPKQD